MIDSRIGLQKNEVRQFQNLYYAADRARVGTATTCVPALP